MAEHPEPLPTRSPPPAFDRPTIEEDGDRKDRHNNAKTSSVLGSPENPILIDLDCEEADTESELGSAQHPILIEDRGALPRSDDTELESDSGPSSEGEPALLRGLKASAQQQNGGQFREGSPAAYPSSVQVAGGQNDPTEPAVATDQGDVDPRSHTTVQTP
jgi:hypothetical protein